MDGTGGQQQCRDLGGLSDAVAPEARGPLSVVWDNAPAHRGEAVREYLGTPSLGLRLVKLPAYSPDFNADEAVGERGGDREPVPGEQGTGAEPAPA